MTKALAGKLVAFRAEDRRPLGGQPRPGIKATPDADDRSRRVDSSAPAGSRCWSVTKAPPRARGGDGPTRYRRVDAAANEGVRPQRRRPLLRLAFAGGFRLYRRSSALSWVASLTAASISTLRIETLSTFSPNGTPTRRQKAINSTAVATA
jgi:hypothetical protein